MGDKIPWRVGRHFPIHVYEGEDLPVGTFQTVAYAKEAVEAVNLRRKMAAKALPSLVPDPLIAGIRNHAGGVSLVLTHARIGTDAAVLWLSDAAYAALLAEAINKVTVKHFPPEGRP